jgi:hypothetical protein
MIHQLIALTCAWAVCAAPHALAQTDPLDPRAPVPPAQYRSQLSSPPALDEAKVGSWRQANDTVSGIGGWREYAREAQRPVPAGTAVPAQSAPLRPAHTHH